jgi:hypothetical protein
VDGDEQGVGVHATYELVTEALAQIHYSNKSLVEHAIPALRAAIETFVCRSLFFVCGSCSDSIKEI